MSLFSPKSFSMTCQFAHAFFKNSSTASLRIGCTAIMLSNRSIVIVTGCAHPGAANIVKNAKELTGMGVYLVLGGFHLSGASENTLLSIIEQFRELGVLKVAPCHCSGDRAKALFKEEFGEDYVEVGVGTDP
jgi:7,8-dihydropterin-6-yl-methyl-4-(beta-D-ribofuranosyl)aminobenzene 5'-phosphate synthase